MKKRIIVLAISIFAFWSVLTYAISNNSLHCPLEGTPECPKNTCPLKGTPDCPYEKGTAKLPNCCVKK